MSDPAVQPQRLQQLLRGLVDIYSPSGKEEEILDFVRATLTTHGLPVADQPVDGNRCNLIVAPPGLEPSCALIGHLDTVMAYDLDHYGYRQQGDWVRGLGAADMKGGCAAMIEAFIALWESERPRPAAVLALVVGEEEEGDGARKLARELHVPWALIGEPTDLCPCLSDYGYLEVQLTTRGRRVHASLAHTAPNPIESMLRLLLRLSHELTATRPEVVYNIRDVSNSQSGFAVPERCDAWLDLHLPPSAPVGLITAEIEESLARERLENLSLDATLRFTTIHSGYELPEKGPIVEGLQHAYARHGLEWRPQTFRSHSDANILWAAGIKPIILGPGQLERAHTPDEAVSFQQIHCAAELYLDLLLALPSPPSRQR